jgi:hypothetical protein
MLISLILFFLVSSIISCDRNAESSAQLILVIVIFTILSVGRKWQNKKAEYDENSCVSC